jgi:hypothetical protein
MKSSLTLARPLLIVFVAFTGFFVAGKNILAKWGMDQDVAIVGNIIVFVLVFISFLLMVRSVRSSNPQAFVRAMYLSFLLKFFALAIAAFVYIQIAKKDVNKPALFACMGLYLVYTVLEVGTLMKVLKEKKNA